MATRLKPRLRAGECCWRVLQLLLEHPRKSSHLEGVLDMAKPDLQYHLARLRRWGLIAYDGRSGLYCAGVIPPQLLSAPAPTAFLALKSTNDRDWKRRLSIFV